MAGLDIATDRSTYKYNLIANRDFTVVYKISLRSLKESNPDIIKYLLPIYLNQTERMRLFLDKKKEIEMSDLFYHPKYKSKKKALTDHNETFKYAESVIEKIKNAVKPSYNEVKQEIKVLPKKEPGFYNKIKKFLMTKKRKLGTLHALEIFQNKTSLDKLKDYFTNDKSPEKTKNFTLNRLQKKNTLYLTQQNFMDLNLPLDFNTSSRGSKLSSKNLISFDNRKLSTGLQKKKLSKEVSFNEENSIKEFTLDSTLKSKNSTYQSRLSLKRSEILIEGDSNYDDRRNSTVDHLKEEKQFSDRLKINLKYKIDKPIRDTLNMWKKKNKSNIAYYDSGNFSMPLVTESFMNNTGQ